MAIYNKFDVLSTEEYFNILKPWGVSLNYSVFSEKEEYICDTCGGDDFSAQGVRTSKVGQFRRYKCKKCGSWHQGKLNLLSKNKKASLLKAI